MTLLHNIIEDFVQSPTNKNKIYQLLECGYVKCFVKKNRFIQFEVYDISVDELLGVVSEKILKEEKTFALTETEGGIDFLDESYMKVGVNIVSYLLKIYKVISCEDDDETLTFSTTEASSSRVVVKKRKRKTFRENVRSICERSSYVTSTGKTEGLIRLIVLLWEMGWEVDGDLTEANIKKHFKYIPKKKKWIRK